MTSALQIAGGLIALIIGADLLVRASTALASWLGIRPMMIGLTVVSLGTSVPELAVGIGAARSGNPGLAIGNIVGTNLVNLLLILGLSAVLVPIVIERATLRFDLPAMTAAAVLLYLLSIDGTLTTLDGAILLLGAVAYTAVLVQVGRRESADLGKRAAVNPGDDPERDGPASDVPPAADGHRPLRQVLLLVVAIGVVVIGAEWLVDGAVSSARSLGVSDAVIGLTIVAIGTSAPELVTTIMSTLRGERDVAVGNLIGSSIYNIGAVLGLTVLVAPHGVPVPDDVLAADLVLLVVATAAAVPVFLTGSRISRAEGGLFVGSYIGYLLWLLLART
jgi:cation:H+ antiporter